MQQPSTTEPLATPRILQQLGVVSVGFKDRGHGHGDLAVLGPGGMVLAEVRGGMLPTAPNGQTVQQLVDNGFVVSDLDLAMLLAAAPDLYCACVAAHQALRCERSADDPLVRQLAKALTMAAPPNKDGGVDTEAATSAS
ncbi:MAG: hypothetical protein Q7R80_02585 [bacterium]|nr:hypothetical protein [bacterium]